MTQSLQRPICSINLLFLSGSFDFYLCSSQVDVIPFFTGYNFFYIILKTSFCNTQISHTKGDNKPGVP